VFSGGGTLQGTTTIAASAGVATFTDLRLDTSGLHTLTASGTLTIPGAVTVNSGSFNIASAALNHFLVEAQGGGAIGTQTAGASFNIQITAQDANNNTVTGFTGTVDLTSNRTIGSGGGTTAAFTAGVLNNKAITLNQSGAASTITATKTASSETGTSAGFTENRRAPSKYIVEAQGVGGIGNQNDGSSFNVRVTAQDAINNTVTGFTGTVDLTSNRTIGAGGGTTVAFTAGVLSSTAITLNQSGASSTITATKTAGSETGTSAGFT